jgi:hypothetical protein
MSTVELGLAPTPRGTGTAEPSSGEPRPARRSRPLTQYWDHESASWQTVGPIPAPRRGQ